MTLLRQFSFRITVVRRTGGWVCVLMGLFVTACAQGESPAGSDQVSVREIRLPQSLVPQLDRTWGILVCFNEDQAQKLPLKYAGPIIAGTAETFRQQAVAHWIKQHQIDFQRQMLIVLLRGYEDISREMAISNLRTTPAEFLGDLVLTKDTKPPTARSVCRVLLCPKSERVAVYQGGPNPVFSVE